MYSTHNKTYNTRVQMADDHKVTTDTVMSVNTNCERKENSITKPNGIKIRS